MSSPEPRFFFRRLLRLFFFPEDAAYSSSGSAFKDATDVVDWAGVADAPLPRTYGILLLLLLPIVAFTPLQRGLWTPGGMTAGATVRTLVGMPCWILCRKAGSKPLVTTPAGLGLAAAGYANPPATLLGFT